MGPAELKFEAIYNTITCIQLNNDILAYAIPNHEVYVHLFYQSKKN